MEEWIDLGGGGGVDRRINCFWCLGATLQDII